MLLTNKTAIVYGGAGAIGSAVARVFAGEGATVHLVGRTREPLENLAEEISGSGGRVEVAPLDATDRAAVAQHADDVVERAAGSTSPSTPRPTTTCTVHRWSIWLATMCCAASPRQSPPT